MYDFLRGRFNPPVIPGLNAASYTFSTKLFEKFPTWIQFAYAQPCEDSTENSIVVEVPSPNSDIDWALVMWMEDTRIPSLGFGPFSVGGDELVDSEDPVHWEQAIVALASAIFENEAVLVREAGSTRQDDWTLWNIGDRAALADRICEEIPSKRIEIFSWAGRLDGELGMDDFEH